MNAQVKAVLEKMSSVEKYFRTAPYLRCGEILTTQNGQITACSCEGWKNPALFYTEPYIMKEDEQHSCAACKHKIVSHGNLNAIKPEELDKVVCVVMQIEQHIQEAQRLATDPVQANKHTERANQLKQILGMKFRAIIAQNLANYQATHQGTFTTVAPPEPMEISDPKSNDYIGNPPFEKPVIIQILKNYMEYKYAPLRAKNPVKAKGAEKIVKLFVVGLNKFELPPPTDQLSDRIYLVNYKRWRYYCIDSKRPCRLVEIFGRTLLRTIMKQVVEALMKNGYFTPDIEPYVPEFFIDLEKEVNTETSVTLLEDFALQLKAREMQNVPGVIQPAQGPTPVMPMAAPEEVTAPTTTTTTTTTATTVVTPPVPTPAPAGSQRKRKNQAAAQENAPVTKVTPGRNKKQKQTNIPEEPAAAESSAEGGSSQVKSEGEQSEVSGEAKREARKEEADGQIEFQVITNDREPQHMIWLTACKNIFSKQLPMMPKEYIVRLVFDRNHRSLVLLKHNKVYGAISFRPYHEQGFLEIAFCAITATEQGKGYGSHLMNHLKDHAQKDGILTFLTYADNYAIVFFKKQGFTKTVDHPRKKWQGFIKDYDGGTLMECKITTTIDYLKVPEMIAVQKKAINDKINDIASSHIVHKGLIRKENGTINIEQIPGIRETGWRIHAPTEEDYALLQTVLEDVLQKIKDHGSSWPFLVPVSREEVPDYYDVIKDPIDLETIEKRLFAKNFYLTKEIFIADIKRMCDNCRVYNREDTEYYKCANDIQNEFLKRGRYFKRLEAPPTATDGNNNTNNSNNNNNNNTTLPSTLPTAATTASGTGEAV